MELWIRSQDKETLKKINNIEINFLNFKKYSYTKDIESKGEYSIRGNGETIGQYKTKKRALEILDEIQSKLHGTFLLKAKEDSYAKELIEAQKYLKKLNSIFLVTGAEKFDLEPINKNIYVYEMPQE